MDASSRSPVTHAGYSSILHQTIVSQTKKPHCCEQAAGSFIPFNQQGNDMKVYVTPIYNRKEYLPLTLQYFSDELEGFNRLSRKLGLSPPTLLKKTVEAGMPLVVKSLEQKQAKDKGSRS